MVHHLMTRALGRLRAEPVAPPSVFPWHCSEFSTAPTPIQVCKGKPKPKPFFVHPPPIIAVPSRDVCSLRLPQRKNARPPLTLFPPFPTCDQQTAPGVQPNLSSSIDLHAAFLYHYYQRYLSA